jgi:parvulin-like peptidyl-prolyl isomerase
MKTFKVEIPEVHYQTIIVEAEDEAKAIAAAKNAEGEYANGTEYAYTIEDYDAYRVEEA